MKLLQFKGSFEVLTTFKSTLSLCINEEIYITQFENIKNIFI